jgi:tetratricopeptide (TPR) repeat protein
MKRFPPILLTLLAVFFLAGLGWAQDVKTYIDRGTACLEAGKFEEALKEFSQALKLKPNDAALYDYLGTAKRCKGLDDQALQDYNKAIELDPKFARAYRDRAMVYYDKTDFTKSLSDLEKAKSLGYRLDEDFVKMVRRKAAEKK